MPLALTGEGDFIWGCRKCSREGMASGVHWKNERSEKRKPLFPALDGRYYSGEHTSVWRGGETTRKGKKRPKRWALPQQREKPSGLSSATKSSAPATDTTKRHCLLQKGASIGLSIAEEGGVCSLHCGILLSIIYEYL